MDPSSGGFLCYEPEGNKKNPAEAGFFVQDEKGPLLDGERIVKRIGAIASVVAVTAGDEEVVGLGIKTVWDQGSSTLAILENKSFSAGKGCRKLTSFAAGIVRAGGTSRGSRR